MNLLSSLFGSPLPSVNAADLNEKLKNGKRSLVVDVRQPEEYTAGHIAGSKLIPLSELNKRVNELPKDKEIICVCASGSRNQVSRRRRLQRVQYAGWDVHVAARQTAYQKGQRFVRKSNKQPPRCSRRLF